MKGYANPQLLISPGELFRLLEAGPSSNLQILDLRPPEAYTAGHVPGALHLDLWGVSLIDTDPAPLNAFMWMIEHVLAVHGVTADTPVVVYDEHSGIRAARAFWFLEYFGHPWEFGPRKAKELLLTGDSLDAEDARALGMVSKVFPADTLTENTLAFARRIAQVPSMAALLVKESEGGRDLPRGDVRDLLHLLVDVVVQLRRDGGRFRMSEVWYDPLRKRALAA